MLEKALKSNMRTKKRAQKDMTGVKIV